MKNYPILNVKNYIKTVREYVIELDNKVGSLVDYLYNFEPNYQILNYTAGTTVPYYEEKDLKTLDLINITDDKYLILNINYLPKHLGIYNNFSHFDQDKRFWTDNHGTSRIGKEGTVVIAKGQNTLPIEDAPLYRGYSDKNYFIARLNAFATFYHFHYQMDYSKKTSIAKGSGEYIPAAEEKYGTVFLTTLSQTQPRFFNIHGIQRYKNDGQHEIGAYNKEWNGQIISKIGSIGTNSYLLNHEIYGTDKVITEQNSDIQIKLDDYEECFCDDQRLINMTNIDSLKIPTYNISIKDGINDIHNIYFDIG